MGLRHHRRRAIRGVDEREDLIFILKHLPILLTGFRESKRFYRSMNSCDHTKV